MSEIKYPGVTLHKATGKWHAYMNRDGKRVNIGFFATQEEAIEARRAVDEPNFSFKPGRMVNRVSGGWNVPEEGFFETFAEALRAALVDPRAAD